MSVVTKSLPVKELHESPFHHRSEWGDMEGLAASIEEHGIQSPIKVRPRKAGGFEIIFGHRRLRAAVKAKLDEVPCLIEDMSDLDAALVQTVENGQRQDVSPLDEADDYKALLDQGMKAEEIAQKIGKARATVYNRLKLCSLGKAGRKALAEGHIDASVATLVARMPTEQLQAAVLKEVTRDGRWEGLTFRQAQEVLVRDFSVRLSEASFDLKDKTLNPKWEVTCEACQHRSGNMKDAPSKEANLCMNPPCFAVKRDTAFKRAADEAKKKGLVVIDGMKPPPKGAQSIFERGVLHYQASVVDLEGYVPHELSGGENLTWAKVVGKHVTPILARDDRGRQRFLADRKEAQKALMEHGPKALVKKLEAQKEEKSEKRDESKKRKEVVKLQAAIYDGAAALAIKAAPEKLGMAPGVIACILCSEWGPVESYRDVAESRAAAWLGMEEGPYTKALKEAQVGKAKGDLARKILVAEYLVCERGAFLNDAGDGAQQWFELLGVDLAKVTAAVKAQLREEGKGKAKGPKGPLARKAGK